MALFFSKYNKTLYVKKSSPTICTPLLRKNFLPKPPTIGNTKNAALSITKVNSTVMEKQNTKRKVLQHTSSSFLQVQLMKNYRVISHSIHQICLLRDTAGISRIKQGLFTRGSRWWCRVHWCSSARNHFISQATADDENAKDESDEHCRARTLPVFTFKNFNFCTVVLVLAYSLKSVARFDHYMCAI